MFDQNFARSLLSLRLVSALMCEIRGHGEHPKFDNFGIDKLLNFDNKQVKRKPGVLQKMREGLFVLSSIEFSSIRSRSITFEPKNFRKWLRGKLGMQVTRKVYELTRSQMLSALSVKLPPSNLFGAEAFSISKQFIGKLSGFDEYCAQRTQLDAL